MVLFRVKNALCCFNMPIWMHVSIGTHPLMLLASFIQQRGRRGGGFGARTPARKPAPARRPASTAAAPPPKTTPAPMQSQPPATSGGGGMLSGIGSTIAQGMAFGTGSAVAHRAVGAAAGALSGDGGTEAAPVEYDQQQQPMQQQPQGACAQDKTMFFECLKENKGDQEACRFLYDQLQQCQRNETSMSFNY